VSLLGFRSEDERDSAAVPDVHGRSRRRRRPRWRGALAILVALGIIAVGGVVVYRVASSLVVRTVSGPSDFAGPGTTPVSVRVADGASTRTIARTLADAGVVATDTAFLSAAAADAAATGIQSGTYVLKKGMSARQALAAMLDPASRTGLVPVPEGSTLAATLQLVSTRSGIPLAQLRAAAARLPAGPLAAYRPRTAEGFLFPATYDVQRSTPPDEVVRAMVARFEQTAAGLDLAGRSRAMGLTPYQVLVVASLVQAEVSDPADQARVARVLYNRVRAGMRLELDSTVHYVTGRNGSVFTSDADRAVASPYNTYRVKGLPPTPIDSPGTSALRAALAPAAGPWLFYVTVDLDTGRTVFSTTVTQQQQNVALLRRWCSAHQGRC